MKHSSPDSVLTLFLLLIVSGTITVSAFGADGDTLFVSNSSGLPGEAGRTFSVDLINVTVIKGLLFTLSDVPDSLVVTDVALTARSGDFRFDTTSVNGALKILMIPSGSASLPISAGSGSILDITVSVDPNAVGGTKATLSLGDVSLADDSNQPVTYALESGTFWFGQKGDVIYNGTVDLFDVLRMIDIAIQRPPAPSDYELWAGDLDDNGVIDVVDIGQAIDMAVGIPRSAASRDNDQQPNIVGSARIDLPSVPENFKGTVEIPVRIDASAPVSGVQLTLRLDHRKYRVATPNTTDRTSDMTLVSKLLDDELQVLLCSIDGKPIPAGEGPVLTLPVTVHRALGEAEPIPIEWALVGTEGGGVLQALYDQSGGGAAVIPETFALYQNNPNPFNMSTQIAYDIPNLQDGPVAVRLAVFNIQGQLVRILEDRQRGAGRYTVHWNGMNDFGDYVSSGVYFYRLMAGDVVLTKKLAVLK